MNLDHRVENFESLNKGSNQRVLELQQQLDTTQANIQSSRIEMEQMNQVLGKLVAAIQEAENDFRSVDLGYNEVSQRYNKQNIEYTRQHSKMDTIRQEFRFRTNQLNELRRQITNNTEQLAGISKQAEEAVNIISKNEAEFYTLLQQKEKDEAHLNLTDRDFYKFRNLITQREGQINQKRREKENCDAILQGLKDKINGMKVQVAGLSERLTIEFKVRLEDILEQARTTNLTIEALTAEAEKLKKRMENMGEINPTAIEAFSEVKVRHTFITEQRNDLNKAKESLQRTIEEVEQTANTRFFETFNLVRENFITVFKALFTAEDNCDLRLTDPENLAESNIEIYAQPKGKKPSTLTQLSGGEKTLTSTAFLFAIYLIKPAPFCILDEVDAPLDDANVGKFTQMIRKFSDNSQFIIVTHNKQTMASVDVISGVTMQEAGVSKLVPVDFRSLN